MYLDALFADDEYEELNFNTSDFVEGFRDRYGSSAVAGDCYEAGFCEYDELVDLGMALGSIGSDY